MAHNKGAKQILMVVGDYVEDYETMVPFQALLMVGHHVDVVSPGKKKGQAVRTAVHDFLEGEQTYTELRGHNFVLNHTFDEVDVKKYDALVIPGGRAPEHLRQHPKVVELVKHFVDTNKPIASICHGFQLLAAVPGAVKGKKCAAYFALEHDVKVAGAVWENPGVEGVVVDGNLVSAVAWPGHPAWLKAFLHLLGTKVEL